MSGGLRLVALAASVLLLPGCGNDDHDHDDHDHDHGDHGDHGHGDHGDGHEHAEDAIAITRWTDTLELFAEHPPAVVGEEATFLAHVTVLDGFAAPTEGSVTLVLSGPASIESRADEPLRPGIFAPTFQPTAGGTYRGRLEVRLPDVQGDIEGFEIEVHAPGGHEEAHDHEEEEAGASTISFLKEQQWRVPFATAFAEQRELVPTVEVSGEVATPPGGSAEIGAPIAGRVVAPRNGLARPGERVTSGQLLATLAPAPSAPEESARATLVVAEAQARAATARVAVERAERLLADRAISQRELELARSEAQVAEEAVVAARRAQRLFTSAASGRGPGTFRLSSPIAGVLTEVDAAPGSSVSAGDVLFRIVDPSELWIRARVPEHDAPRVRSDGDASYRILGLDEWLPIEIGGETPAASVVNVGQTVDRRSRTVDLIYALHTPEPRLRVGATVRVAVPVGRAVEAVSVLRSSLVQDEGRDVVYVQVEGEDFEERVVRLGARAGGWVAIEGGVEPGERVVTQGANLIRLAARAATEPSHGHVH